MTLHRRKDLSRLVARRKVRARGRRHYLLAYLWQDRDAYLAATNGGEDDGSIAASCHNEYKVNFKGRWEQTVVFAPPLLSEVHFVRGRWSAEIVAHELAHSFLHRLRAVGPPAEILLAQTFMDAEEAVCYEFGEWFRTVYRWLWEVDPQGEQVRERGKAR